MTRAYGDPVRKKEKPETKASSSNTHRHHRHRSHERDSRHSTKTAPESKDSKHSHESESKSSSSNARSSRDTHKQVESSSLESIHEEPVAQSDPSVGEWTYIREQLKRRKGGYHDPDVGKQLETLSDPTRRKETTTGVTRTSFRRYGIVRESTKNTKKTKKEEQKK